MAIRYDKDYNAKINRIVRNFNQKRNRAIKRGFKYIPPALTVSELKARYENRTDLNRELKLISKFNADKDEALKVVETTGGAKAIKWEMDYLKANIRHAKDYYDREIKKVQHLDTEMNVTKKEYLNNLITKRNYLDLELAELDPSQLRTYRKTIDEYLYANERKLQGYRNWMSEVEQIMRVLGYNNQTIDEFFEGFDELTPEQFLRLYQQSAIVSRIYELYIPTNDGSFKLSTTEDDAKELIDTFMAEKDEMINRIKVQEGVERIERLVTTATPEEIAKITRDPKKKRKLEELTEHDIEMAEALGLSIEDLLK